MAILRMAKINAANKARGGDIMNNQTTIAEEDSVIRKLMRQVLAKIIVEMKAKEEAA